MNSPKQIAEFFSGLGVTKAETPLRKMLLLSVLAGIFIALAGVGATIAGAVVNKFAGACVFPAGLAMVVIAGSELFTGDNNRNIPGRGHIDWDDVFKALKDIDYKKDIVSEPFLMMGNEVGYDIRVWRPILENPTEENLDAGAAELLNFTKKMLDKYGM